MAQTCARELQIPYRDLLVKQQWTFSQASKSKGTREDSLQKVFRASEVDFVPKHIILVDDVMTTGSTLTQAANVLKQTYPQASIW